MGHHGGVESSDMQGQVWEDPVQGSGKLWFSCAAQDDSCTRCGTQFPLLLTGIKIPAGHICHGFDGNTERTWSEVGVNRYQVPPTTVVTIVFPERARSTKLEVCGAKVHLEDALLASA